MGLVAHAAGDGLAGIFDRHRSELLRFLTARCGAQDEAEDLLQDLWIKLSTQAMGPVANGRAYLFRMANNLVLDRARSRRRAMARDHKWNESHAGTAALPEDRPDPATPADEEIAREQEAAILRKVIESLPPGARKALQLYRFEEMGQAEIAETMGISRSGVEKHLALAMKHLRNALADCGWFDPAASQDRNATRGGEPRKGHEP